MAKGFVNGRKVFLGIIAAIALFPWIGVGVPIAMMITDSRDFGAAAHLALLAGTYLAGGGAILAIVIGIKMARRFLRRRAS